MPAQLDRRMTIVRELLEGGDDLSSEAQFNRLIHEACKWRASETVVVEGGDGTFEMQRFVQRSDLEDAMYFLLLAEAERAGKPEPPWEKSGCDDFRQWAVGEWLIVDWQAYLAFRDGLECAGTERVLATGATWTMKVGRRWKKARASGRYTLDEARRYALEVEPEPRGA